MHKSKILFFLLVFFILGIGSRSFYEISPIFILFLSVISISTLTIFWKNKFAALAAFFILIFLAGIVLLDGKLISVDEYDFSQKKIESEGLVIRQPERKENYQKIFIRLNEIEEDVLVNYSLYPKYFYGDIVELRCDLEVPKNRGDGFDYRMYLAAQGTKYICRNAEIEKVGEEENLYSLILKLRNKLDNAISSSIPQPEGALASGILFGGSSSMSKKVQEDFSRTGMTHIVAVSGYNVTIIAEYLILFGIFLGLWRKQSLWFALVGIFIFVAMIGFPASAVRAGIMGGILIWAMKKGRLANSQNAIVFAGAVMLVLNPLLLRWDAGFQLSFLATLGIVYLSPLAERLSVVKRDPTGIAEIIFLTISAQIFVLPVIMVNFGTFSVVSLFANILVLPIVPFSMLLSFLAALAGLILPIYLNVFAWLAFIPLKYEISVITFLSKFSWASIDNVNLNPTVLLLYYLILSFAVIKIRKRILLCQTEKKST